MPDFEEPFEAGCNHTGGDDACSRPGAEDDRRQAIEQALALLGAGGSQDAAGGGAPGPVTEEDKRLIMWNIDELFLV
jgi:hypothetical protein